MSFLQIDQASMFGFELLRARRRVKVAISDPASLLDDEGE
jgi:hypothetical protein